MSTDEQQPRHSTSVRLPPHPRRHAHAWADPHRPGRSPQPLPAAARSPTASRPRSWLPAQRPHRHTSLPAHQAAPGDLTSLQQVSTRVAARSVQLQDSLFRQSGAFLWDASTRRPRDWWPCRRSAMPHDAGNLRSRHPLPVRRLTRCRWAGCGGLPPEASPYAITRRPATPGPAVLPPTCHDPSGRLPCANACPPAVLHPRPRSAILRCFSTLRDNP